MKKHLLKVFSVVLAFVMVFSSTSIAYAKNTVTPVILVHGLGANDIYNDVGTDSEAKVAAYGLDVKSLLTGDGILAEAIKLLSNQKSVDYDALFKKLGDYFESTKINCTKDGNAQAGQGIVNYWTDSLANHKDFWQNGDNSERAMARQMCEKIGAKNVYCFNYDWRLDVRENAKRLKGLVNIVKKRAKVKKVTLVGVSLGGAVLSSYMDAYKSQNDVARYLYINPAIMGVDVARLLRFDIKFDKKTVMQYIKHMETAFDGGSQSTTFKLVGALADVRIGYLADNLNKIASTPKLRNQFFNVVLKRWIGNCPAYWECIAYNDFDACVKNMTSIGFLDKNSGLYKKISAYHKVQGRFRSNIKYVKKKGAQVAIIVNYGTMGIPATSKVWNQTDGLIDVKYASGGATVAAFGKKLKGKNAKGKYVSPDKVINSKTSVLPNSTWYIRNVIHTQFHYGTPACKFIANLACGKVNYTLKAVKKKYGYKQYLKADSNQKLSNVKG